MKKISPIHPGEILLEEFMKLFGLSQNRLGRETKRISAQDQRDRAWQARHHGRYGPSARALLRQLCQLLAWSSDGLRPRHRFRQIGRAYRERNPDGAGIMGMPAMA
uniref:Addiction module antidote protein, HigA family n=1 Tax=Candidatus Kentrum sp. TUN TaxID=2126343 RepID=A0A451A1Y7_9GAMM|nr:MAG: hypothetical protein BECKTUN1418F_GA0071002_11975 [Candidatus Kentron sp. TUN]VFK69353.1 MAG: hypothetical protein BECKTUN1418E_GA0071001_11945 [Candidatus Kentron sp. TUN]